MQTAIAVIQLVMQLFPLLIQLVTAIEQQFPQSGQGAAKLSMVRDTLQAVFTGAADLKVSFDQVWPALSVAIASIVSFKNKVGEFK